MSYWSVFYVCGHECRHMHIALCVWNTEQLLGCSMPSTLFETGPSLWLHLTMQSRLGGPQLFRQYSLFYLYLGLRAMKLQMCTIELGSRKIQVIRACQTSNFTYRATSAPLVSLDLFFICKCFSCTYSYTCAMEIRIACHILLTWSYR